MNIGTGRIGNPEPRLGFFALGVVHSPNADVLPARQQQVEREIRSSRQERCLALVQSDDENGGLRGIGLRQL